MPNDPTTLDKLLLDHLGRVETKLDAHDTKLSRVLERTASIETSLAGIRVDGQRHESRIDAVDKDVAALRKDVDQRLDQINIAIASMREVRAGDNAERKTQARVAAGGGAIGGGVTVAAIIETLRLIFSGTGKG